MNLHKHLLSARNRVATTDTWTTNSCARDAEGRSFAHVPFDTPLVCFCMFGSLLEEAGVLRDEDGDLDLR